MAALPDQSFVCPILVGRATQLHMLDRALQQPDEAGLKALLLSGEAGIGKSRLAAEAAARASAGGYLVLKGDCFESGRALPYSAVLELLRTYLSGRSVEETASDLGGELREVVELLPELAAIVPDDSPALPVLDAGQEKRRLFHALLRLFVRLAGQRPLLIVIEDLHWADETTLEFLQFLCSRRRRAGPGSQILVLMTYRSDEVQPALAHFLAELDRTRAADELTLNRLTTAETGVMMRAILDLQQPFRRDLLEALHRATNGNPFFIEEVLKAYLVRRDAGLPGEGPGGFRLDTNEAPRSVQDGLRRRLELVGDRARRLLDVAAVSGMRLDVELLRAITGEDGDAMLALLKELVAAQLIVEEGSGFSFRHALTRQAIYSQLLHIERRQLHRDIGRTLESLYGQTPEQIDIHAAELADHFFEGEAWKKALLYCERAGTLANGLSTPAAVIWHLSRACEAARNLSLAPSSQTLRVLANAYEVVGEFERAQATMEASLEAAKRQADKGQEWQALIGLGAVLSARDYVKTGEYWRAALELARAMGDETRLAHSLNRIGNWHLNVEQPAEAVQHHEDALRIFERTGDTGGIAETLDLLGMSWYLGGDMVRSRDYYERALPLFELLNDRQGYISSLSTLSVCAPVYHTDTLLPSVTLAQGAQWLEQAGTTAAEIGWRSGEAYALFDLGLVLGPSGRYDRALECALSGLAIAEEMGHLAWTCAALWTLGCIQLDLLDLDQAKTTLERACATARSTGSQHWRRCTSASLARCYLGLGQTALAASVLDETLQKNSPPRTLGERTIQAARVEVALSRGDAQEAFTLLDGLLKVASPGAVPPRLARLRGDALMLGDDKANAVSAYLQAAKAAEDQEQLGLLWRTHAALARAYRETGQRTRSLEARQAAQDLIDRVAATLSNVPQREAFLDAAVALLPPQVTQRQAARAAYGGLTERERELAALVARGLSNAEIGASLVISERTVETHITNILAKLSFSSRSQIAAWAVQTGLIRLPG